MLTRESLPLPTTLFDYNVSRATERIAVSSDGVAVVMSRLQLSSMPGPDMTISKLLKLCKEIVCILWAELFQQSLDTGIILTDRRTVNVIPVFKGGSKESVDNFCPISLTNVPSKIFEPWYSFFYYYPFM